ncbi:MAG: hypothetical protein ACI4JJ_07525 [Huintestinicola sp.]
MLKITHDSNRVKRNTLIELEDTGEPLFMHLLQRLKPTEKIEVYALINNDVYVTKIVSDVYSFILTETFEPILFSTRWDFCFRRIIHINVNTLSSGARSPLGRKEIINLYGWDTPTVKMDILSSVLDHYKEITLNEVVFELVNGRLFWPTNSISVRFHGTISNSNTMVDSNILSTYNLNAKCIIGIKRFDDISDVDEWSSILKDAKVLSIYSPNCGDDVIIETMCDFSMTVTCLGKNKLNDERKKYEDEFYTNNDGTKIIWN